MATFTKSGYPNLEAPELIPETFRTQHKLLMRSFDIDFKPTLTDIMPAVESPDGGSQRFDWPIITVAQPMAPLAAADEPARYLGAPGVAEETFGTVITKAGFQRRFDEFQKDFTNDLISLKYQTLAKEMVAAINRRIELEIANVLYMNTTAIGQYSPNQDTSRALVADINAGKFYRADKSTEITSLGSMLSGTQWHKNNGDPMRDLAAMKRAHEDMKGGFLTKGFIGPETAMWLDVNPKLIEQLKYTQTVTDGILGMTVMGIKFKKVIGQHYKEASANQATPGGGVSRWGIPGLGDLDYDKWTDRNKVEVMVDGFSTGREWGILSEDTSGKLFCAYVHTLHQAQVRSAVDPFIYEFAEQDPFKVKVRMERAFAPVIEDFANYVLMVNTVDRSYRT